MSRHLTTTERRDYMVKVAMEAFDSTLGGRLAIETALRERMGIVAQLWTVEADYFDATPPRVPSARLLEPGAACCRSGEHGR